MKSKVLGGVSLGEGFLRGVSLGEGFSLRGLKSSEEDGLENISDIKAAFEEFQRLQSVADIAEVAIDVGLGLITS